MADRQNDFERFSQSSRGFQHFGCPPPIKDMEYRLQKPLTVFNQGSQQPAAPRNSNFSQMPPNNLAQFQQDASRAPNFSQLNLSTNNAGVFPPSSPYFDRNSTAVAPRLHEQANPRNSRPNSLPPFNSPNHNFSQQEQQHPYPRQPPGTLHPPNPSFFSPTSHSFHSVPPQNLNQGPPKHDTRIPMSPNFPGGHQSTQGASPNFHSPFSSPPLIPPNFMPPPNPHFRPIAPPPHGQGGMFPMQPPHRGFPPHTMDKKQEYENQKQADKKWVDTWLQDKGYDRHQGSEENDIKIGEAKVLVEGWLELQQQLSDIRDTLSSNLKDDDIVWRNNMKQANSIKQKIEDIKKKFEVPGVMTKLQDRIKKRRKKRTSHKKRQQRKFAEKEDKLRKREELHSTIDQWRHSKIEMAITARKEAKLKKEVEQVLGEVHRKQADVKKYLGLLSTLRKLRNFRLHEAEVKGIYEKPTEEQSKRFTEKIDFMETLMNDQYETYVSEENTLKVMMEEEREQKQRKEREEKKKQELKRLKEQAEALLEHDEDPLVPFRKYYMQAETSLQCLFHIRREWDMFIAPQIVPGADKIPIDWVTPAPPSSETWKTCLQEQDEL